MMAGLCNPPELHIPSSPSLTLLFVEKKAHAELAKKAGGKGPLNTGGQGIKKSGKK
jgi:hypothetical protein